jgi:outer membrane protein OmpA-like peptidoglycan-associated protein
VLEETLRDMRQSARAVNETASFAFTVFANGAIRVEGEDRGFPALRNFPVFPSSAVSPGTTWTGRGIRIADPLNRGEPAAIPFSAEYQYRGVESYKEIPVHRITARYAVRYPFIIKDEDKDGRDDDIPDTLAAPYFSALQGTHTVDILIRAADGLPLMMRDQLDESYSFPGGASVRFRGFTLIFNTETLPLDRPALMAELPEILPGIGISEVPEGIRLSIQDLRFAPDSAELLPAENERLDRIAETLKKAPDRTFLVEGHTAAVGREAGEAQLSLERAKRIVDELVRRGIPAESFIYRGAGGTKPVGDNRSEEGRRLNRRVEITILE